MESKGKELVRKKGALLEERHMLLDWIISDVNSTKSLTSLSNAVSVMNGKDNEGDLDTAVLTSTFEKWVRHRSDNVVNLEQKLLQNDVHIASLEARLKKDRSAEGSEGSDAAVLDEVRR